MHTSDEPPTGATRATPVFLDATGRRLKRARLLGGTITVAVAAYVVLLLSAALGGPSIDAPFLPRPAAPTRGLAALPRATPLTTAPNGGLADDAAGSAAPASPGRVGTPGTGSATSPTALVARATAGLPVSSATASATVTSAPAATTGTPTPPATSPTTAPSATPTHTGRSASAPGRTARPTPSRTR